MNLHFEPITSENRAQAEALEIASAQHGFVESVAECLLEADKRRCWRPVGIYDGDILVGFAMYGFFWEYLPFGRIWLDRLLIDYHYQGNGYGKAAVSELLLILHRKYRRNKVFLSVFDGNDTAIRMYQKAGFHYNGQTDVHGEKVMVYQFNKK